MVRFSGSRPALSLHTPLLRHGEGKIYHNLNKLRAPSITSGILLLPLGSAHRDAQRLQEVQVLRRKCALTLPTAFFFPSSRTLHGSLWLLLHLIQADGGLQHQQDFKSLLPNVGNHTGNLRGLRHALVNCLPQLLDQFPEFLIQVRTSISRRTRRFPYLIF